MKPLTTTQLLAIIRKRGWEIHFDEQGNPRLKKGEGAEQMTPALLNAVKLPVHRERLMEIRRRELRDQRGAQR
jgi:hypothetical protein